MRAPYRLTPMYQWHQQHGALMEEASEWRCPVSYGDTNAEITASNTGVGISDVTPLAKIDVQGHGLNQLLAILFGVSSPLPGRCASLHGTPAPAYLARLAHDRSLVLAGAEQQARLVSYMTSAAGEQGCVHVTDMTSAYAAIRLVGPMSPEVLKKVSQAPVDSMPPDTCVQASAARVWSLLLRRDGSHTPSWVVLVARDYGEYVWEVIISAGKEFQIRPFGTRAQQALDGMGATDVATV